MGLPLRDILHQKAQVCMNLLHTLVISYQIFELISASKKLQLPSRAEKLEQPDQPETAHEAFIEKVVDASE